MFRSDHSYRPRLKKLSDKEADRRLAERMDKAMSRFEIAERLRATTVAQLPKEAPWTQVVSPSRVAQVLQSFLVREVPANPPDYQLLREVGADSVVEFVIEAYGMRSEGGKAGTYLLGYGRMFTLEGETLWRRNFIVDELDSGVDGLDPFSLKTDPGQYRQAMHAMLDAVAAQFAKDLTPPDRHAAPASALPKETQPAPADEAPPRPAEEDPI
ncbi:MAG: hypothetical protein IRZ16_17380 [Myxococcaceae bacterium]|nr:hypothetical protein [Myxococcaceae bacterium]